MKRFFSLFLALLLLALGGCGTNTAAPSVTEQTEPQAAAQTESGTQTETAPAQTTAPAPADTEPAEPEIGTKKVGNTVYKMTFNDEFAGDALDPDKWYIPESKGDEIWEGASHLIKSSEALVQDGELRIRSRLNEKGTPVTVAICTLDKFSQAYGYFEARMKFSSMTGWWGACWMMCGDMEHVDGSPADGIEIDVIETCGVKDKKVNHALHWDGYGPEEVNRSWESDSWPALYTGWHTYAVEWTKDAYIFYIDEKETWRVTDIEICPLPGVLILSNQFGEWTGPLDTSKLPDYTYVDWVRVYLPAEE